MTETRPYMRARAGLARCLWELKRHDEALKHYYGMLKLNTHDNQGIRYVLLACLGKIGREEIHPAAAAGPHEYGRGGRGLLLCLGVSGCLETRTGGVGLVQGRGWKGCATQGRQKRTLPVRFRQKIKKCCGGNKES